SAKHPAASGVRAWRSRALPGGSRARRGARVSFLSDVLAATFRNATPLVYGTVGETYCERAGILNLGIEGTMYAGAFFGFLVAEQTGSLPPGRVPGVGGG